MNKLVDVHSISNSATISNDGWTEAAAEGGERLLRGELLKFSHGHWMIGREALPPEQGFQLVAMGTAAAWVRWAGGKPDRYIVRQPGVLLPDRKELGDTDESRWESDANNKPRDPWQSTRFIHFVNPETAAAYTFSTSTWGGREAVINLADAIARYRSARPGTAPVVVLESTFKDGGKHPTWNPVFKVVGWVGGGGDEEVEPNSPKLVSTSRPDMDDEIPF